MLNKNYIKKISKKNIFLIILILLIILKLINVIFPDLLFIKNFIIPRDEKENSFYIGNTSINIYGYEYNNNKYIQLNNDPQIYINNVHNINISSLIIYFFEPLESDTAIQIFFPDDNGSLSEYNSISKIFSKNTEMAYFNLPKKYYDYLRFDIDGNFNIFDIYVYEKPLLKKSDTLDVILIIVFIITVLFMIIVFLNYIRKNNNIINNIELKSYIINNENNLCKLKNNIIVIFNILFIIIFGFLLLNLIFINKSPDYTWEIYKTGLITNIKQISSAIIIILIFILFYNNLIKNKNYSLISNYIKNNKYYMIIYMLLCLFHFQIIIIQNTNTQIGWDVGMLAFLDTNNPSHISYISRYPNNLLLAYLLKAIRSIPNIFNSAINDFWLIASLFNIIIINITLYYTFIVSEKLFNNIKIAFVCFILSILLFGLFPWIIVPYSDTIAMPFTIIPLLIYLKINKSENLTRQSILYSILLGIILFFGYLIKPSVLILLIAFILIQVLFHINNKKDIIKNIIRITFTIIIIIILSFIWQYFSYSQKTFPLNKESAMSFTHYVMMGMNDSESSNGLYGGWNSHDVRLSTMQENRNIRQKVNIEEIKTRLKNFGILGYIEFLINKAKWVTSDGRFFWGNEGNFANFDLNKSNIFKEIIYKNGKYYGYYHFYAQGIWIIILYFIIYCTNIKNIKNKSIKIIEGITLIKLVIIGILLFILLFEGRSRYFILYLPYFSMLASYNLYDFLKNKKYLFIKLRNYVFK